MTFEKRVEYGWLKREASSASEIGDLLRIVQRGLDDSRVEAISDDLRFISAFNAALTAATTALRASGYRTSTQLGHHVKTIESLELTIHASIKVVQRLKIFNSKRNKSSYDTAGAVSDQDLKEMTKLALELQDQVVRWLEKLHPGLMNTRG